MVDGATTPPPLLQEADLIGLMEKHGIGRPVSVALTRGLTYVHSQEFEHGSVVISACGTDEVGNCQN